MGTKGQTIDDLDDLDNIVALNKKIFYIDSCGGGIVFIKTPSDSEIHLPNFPSRRII